MRIYILRHEDRTQDATFFSPLTEKGLENAEKLIETLENLNVEIIYSSPYIRTLQTVYPFVKKTNNKIKLEYALSEIQIEDIIPRASHTVRLPEYIAKLFCYDSGYQTVFKPEEHKYPETENDVKERVRTFLRQLIAQYGNTDKTLLLVTHQEVCKVILKLVDKNSDVKPPSQLLKEYPKGGLSQVFEGVCWYYKPINYRPQK
jgi:2,3-bisphosphoglycerate-dependent phosphoglycerate mutase